MFFRITAKPADPVKLEIYSGADEEVQKMKQDAEGAFSKLLKFLDWNFDEDLVKKAVEFSSFKKVKEMGGEKNQKYGNGPKDGSFKGEFTRSGEELQFYYELKEETISFVLNKFPDFKKIYPNLIE